MLSNDTTPSPPNFLDRSASALWQAGDGACEEGHPGNRKWPGMRADQILQLAGDGIIVVGESGRILLFNHAAEDIFGYDASEVLGLPVETLLPECSCREHRKHVRLFETEKRSERAAGQLQMQTGRRKDGHEFPVEVTLARHEIDGRTILVAVVRDASDRERERATERLLVEEWQHRLKNVLATVQALARQSLRNTASPEDYARSFCSRIAAMAEAHALLTERRWEGVPLRELVLCQLAPYSTIERGNMVMGEAILLEPGAALAVNLALHELATNAAKYGALSVPAGRVKVLWWTEAQPEGCRLVLEWAELGGPPVRPPERRGFGRRLIECVIAGSASRLEFPRAGVRCRLELPLSGAAREVMKSGCETS